MGCQFLFHLILNEFWAILRDLNSFLNHFEIFSVLFFTIYDNFWDTLAKILKFRKNVTTIEI